MAKERDLQKAIDEVKASLKEKDLESLKDQLLTKINKSGGNITDILNDKSIQTTLQSMLKNKNISNLLQNPEITNQLSSLLKSTNNKELMNQVQDLIKKNKIDKKKK